MKILILFMFVLVSQAWANKKVAVVKLLKGEVSVVVASKVTQLKTEDWVEEGAVVKTADKSFVKLVFVDKSQMNVGPNSEMKIESFTGKDAGVIDLVKGKIRSKVSKDYLQMENRDQSKMFVKTKNAVLGVRGTDFLMMTNGKSSSVVLFEGEILIAKLNDLKSPRSRLEDIVNSGVRVFPGEFSVVEQRKEPTLPSLLNHKQKEVLEKNENFEGDRGPSSKEETSSKRSIIPEGLPGDVVTSDSNSKLNEFKQDKDSLKLVENEKMNEAEGATDKVRDKERRVSSRPEGFVEGSKVKPANGSFLHTESGVIIPPDSSAVLDKNTNSYVDSNSDSRINSAGEFVPPKDMKITNDGKILVMIDDVNGRKPRELSRIPPVVGNDLKQESEKFRNDRVLEKDPNLRPMDRQMGSVSNLADPTTNTNLSTDIRIQNQVEKVKQETRTTIRVRSGENRVMSGNEQ